MSIQSFKISGTFICGKSAYSEMPLNGSIMYVISCDTLPEIKSMHLNEIIEKINTELQNKDEMFHFPSCAPGIYAALHPSCSVHGALVRWCVN